MAGLFSRIQGCFRETYSGRYLAYLLEELFRQTPQELSRALAKFGLKYSHKKDDWILSNGWRFPGKNQDRIADIAILDSSGPRVLVEIKDADAGKKENAAQIDDYLRYVEKHEGVEFLFLSRHIPTKHEGQKLEKDKRNIHQKLFRDLYRAIIGRDPFTRMLKQYLEDIEVDYEREIDPNALHYVAQRMLGAGKRKVADKSVSDFFNAVFSNLSSLGDWIQAANKGRFKRRFPRHLYVDPWHDVQQLERLIRSKKKRDKGRVKEIEAQEWVGEFCTGGEIGFYGSGYFIDGRDRIYVEIGYSSEVNRLQKNPKYEQGVYAIFEWKPWKENDSAYHLVKSKTFPSGVTAEKQLRECLKRARAEALKNWACPKRVMRKFQIP